MSLVDRLSRTLSTSLDLARNGEGKEVLSRARTKIWGTRVASGLARDMTIPFPAPEAKIPISIRLIRPDDVPKVLNVNEPGLSPMERSHIASRLNMLEAGFLRCFVAVTPDDEPCYIHWLITPEENDLVCREFDNQFPQLAEGEILLEGAFTPVAFRGQRIMPAAMAQLAEKAGHLGATRVLTFVGLPNIPSIKGCERAGFTPYTTRETVYRLGSQRTRYIPVS
jgi:hypothetical protein